MNNTTKIYLVGQEWYSADQGDMKNYDAEPEAIYTNLAQAEKHYDVLKKKDDDWGYGFRQAYLIEWDTETQERRKLKR